MLHWDLDQTVFPSMIHLRHGKMKQAKQTKLQAFSNRGHVEGKSTGASEKKTTTTSNNTAQELFSCITFLFAQGFDDLSLFTNRVVVPPVVLFHQKIHLLIFGAQVLNNCEVFNRPSFSS